MTATFEWDNDLGPRWFNQDNLANLLTTKNTVEPHILSIVAVDFNENDRVQDELDSLVCKRKSLGKFINTDLFFNLDPYAQRLLERQYTLMTAYVIILEEGIEA